MIDALDYKQEMLHQGFHLECFWGGAYLKQFIMKGFFFTALCNLKKVYADSAMTFPYSK